MRQTQYPWEFKNKHQYMLHIYLLYWPEKPLLLLRYSKSTQVEFWTSVSRTDTPSMVFFQMSTDAPARLDSWHTGCVRNVTRLAVARNNMITWSYHLDVTGASVSVWCLFKVGKWGGMSWKAHTFIKARMGRHPRVTGSSSLSDWRWRMWRQAHNLW